MAISTVKATIDNIEYDLVFNETTNRWQTEIITPSVESDSLDAKYYNVTLTITDTNSNSITVDSTHPTWGNLLKLIVKNIDINAVYIQLLDDTIQPIILIENAIANILDDTIVEVPI